MNQPPPEMNQPEAAGTEQRVSEAIETAIKDITRWAGFEPLLAGDKADLKQILGELLDASQPASATLERAFRDGSYSPAPTEAPTTSPEAQSLPADAVRALSKLVEAVSIYRRKLRPGLHLRDEYQDLADAHDEAKAALTSAKPASTSGEAEGAKRWVQRGHCVIDPRIPSGLGEDVLFTCYTEDDAKEAVELHNATLRNSGSEKALEEIAGALERVFSLAPTDWFIDSHRRASHAVANLIEELRALKAASADKGEA